VEIVVCVKPLPDPETRLRPTADGASLDPEGVKFTLGGYDESAVEQALLLKESVPGSRVRAVSAGPAPRAEEVLRAALALGCDEATWVRSDAGSLADPLDVARALAEAVRAVPHDLVLLGKQAADDEEGIVAGALAELLAVPHFGFVTDLRWSAAASTLSFQRALDGEVEAWDAPLPCAVALQQAWNDPRTAKLPAILKSRKAAIAQVPASPPPGVAARSVAETFRLPPARTGARMIDYRTPEEAAEKLVRLLKEEAKVFP
jgi:electron transfer flavoprotein beta subunit